MRPQILGIIAHWNQINQIIHSQHHDLAQKYNLTVEQFNLLVELDELNLDLPDDSLQPTIG